MESITNNRRLKYPNLLAGFNVVEFILDAVECGGGGDDDGKSEARLWGKD